MLKNFIFAFKCIEDIHISESKYLPRTWETQGKNMATRCPGSRMRNVSQDTEMNTAYRCFLPRVTGLAENVDHTRTVLPCELTSHTVGVPDTTERCRRWCRVVFPESQVVSPFWPLLPIHLQRRYRQHSGCYPIKEEDLGLWQKNSSY